MGYLPLVTEIGARRVGFFIQDYVLYHSFIFVYWKQKWQNASAQVIAIQDKY